MLSRLIWAPLAVCALSSAHAADQNFAIGNFEELIVEGDILVTLETGKAPSAKAKGPREKVGALRVERQGNVVRIRLSSVQANRAAGGPVTVAVTGRNIRRLALVGSGRITADKLDADTARIELRGSGMIEVADLKASKLVTMLAGNGRLNVAKGSAFNSEVVIDGGFSFSSAGLVSQNLKLVQSGPAVTLLTVDNIAEINNNGAGSITIEGPGTCLIRRPGSATINCKKTGQ